jgi:hypothetical protein
MYDELIVKFNIILCVGIVIAGFIDPIIKDIKNIKEKQRNKQKGKRTDGNS